MTDRDESDREAHLARAMPRTLIAMGLADAIASDWAARARAAVERAEPPFPRYDLDEAMSETLFEVRRAGRVVRGLEDSVTALAREEAGLSRAEATKTDSGHPRISRLLVVSSDGSPRFFRQVEQLKERYVHRLEVVLLEVDEHAFGEAVYGPGKRVRAILLNQKDAVIHFLEHIAPAAVASEAAGEIEA